ncbi:Leucyl aminopeptidase yscIV [Friedmanniomyces endolithicus]|uniref:Leukotriene A(4) hydrolase n=1 Tax=Friedmanniomyces endolithicus TaxID=329885 RepID=A0A4V6WK47_9PEZI|nr:Leucyl aminopeptidase yscIV [Friedmanniomyces endolithicus]KAK0357446.1 Leucyl aminopeptidase yscIV [Friedmanniomyces endolithicus]KAK0769473.1 Leucyl aminopeptidase yscIV [Friedmanniomyces endolithicus]KAK0803844.1 Leucyl aminopeptidase yscIV [Friedmanniomyces endolithicus]KAK0806840.1 Leucyl aminopeptidase yscIV [Friedmanniomyces endolithicus]
MVIRPASASVAKTGAAGMHQRRDPNTLANYNEWMTTDTTADFTIDFDAKRLKGTVHLTLENLAKDSRQIILDTSFLEVSSVRANDETAEYQLAASRVEPYGTPLTISLPAKTEPSKSNVTLSIDVATTKDCTALQWLTPAQTSNKKHPYIFSQCQAIHARSLFPCQDTPDVKSTFTFNIRSPLPVLASGLPTGPKDFQPGEDGKSGTLLYTFHQSIPMPSYLFALASGDIASASIGPRSTVWTGPEELTASQWEFEKDTEAYIQAAEKIVYPYAWTTYNVLVLPPSFPYGGMENPVYTFATPTVVSGDRQNVDVIAHELSHSWSGNLVSNASWEHFWLNEGWTEYLERRIIAAVHGSDQYRDFSAIIGWKALEDSIAQFGEDHNFTKLIPDLKGKDPDDAFSSVPYEKGFVFLYHFEKLLGTEKWDKFIPHYFTTFKQKSVDSYEFKATLLDFFANDVDAAKKLQNVDWDTWFYAPGFPPKPDFDTTLADQCYALADKWQALAENHKESDFKPSAKDIESWTANQSVVFLERLQSLPHHPITPDLINLMGSSYGYESSKNVELVSRFYTLGLMSRAESVYKPTAELLGKVGRMKFVRPLYRQLIMRDRKLAERTFEENRGFYHPICRGMVEKLFEKHA